MAKRSEFQKPVLGPDELAELRRKLGELSVTAVADYYHGAYLQCALKDGKAPPARDIQELVQAWKELRKW